MKHFFSCMIVLLIAKSINAQQGVGIGTSTPKAAFNVSENKTVLFGKDTSGGGAKLMWIPSKYAFRAGVLGQIQGNPSLFDSTIWDYDSIGLASFAAGFQNKAKGFASVSMGALNNADSTYAVALGVANVASNWCSFAAGLNNQSTGYGGISLGFQNKAKGNFSIAAGFRNQSIVDYSTTIGSGNISNSYQSFVAGSYNDSISGSSPTLWIPADPLFIIGNGTSEYNRNNAMIILKNGKTGFGTNAPEGLMHLKHDGSALNPQLILEEQGDSYARMNFKNGNPGYWSMLAYNPLLFEPNVNARLSFYFSTLGGNIFSLKGNGDANLAGTLTQYSDERLKQHINPMRSVLSKLIQLNGYTYQWKDTTRGKDEQIGLLAQEVEKQFPQLVHTDEKGIKSVAYSNMVPVLLQAIKEQQQQIDELKRLVEEKLK